MNEPTALPHDHSETGKCRSRLARFCKGTGLDVGFGGSAIVPTSINFDMPVPYTSVGKDPQHVGGDCFKLDAVFKPGSLDYIYSSHLVEDFIWDDVATLIAHWRDMIKRGGMIIIYCPDEQVYRKHCEETGQPYNEAHKNADFSLAAFKERIVSLDRWDIIHEGNYPDEYSWEIVLGRP